MADNTHLLLRSHLKQLRLPTIGSEFEKLAREAAASNETNCTTSNSPNLSQPR